jgi:magnesium-transporting ATPase (P-type)
VALGTEAESASRSNEISASTLLSWRRTRMLAARGASIAVMSVGSFVVVRFALDLSWESARTAMFTVLVVSHLLYAFAVHLDRPAGEKSAPLRSLLGARGVLIAVGVGIVLQLAVVAVPLLHDVFDTTSLTGGGWLLCLSAGLVAPVGIWLTGRVGSRTAT